MSSSDLAISVRGLSKSYKIRHQHEQHITLAEQALSLVRHPLRRRETETFWALDDVNFDVHKGEVLGIIGRNGAGKSTLLKVLSRITAPTKGEVRLYGRVGSLLEVGTGFHPELTGRENVYLNGSILGMRRKEIDKQFDAIVDFAGVEKFLDTPVKRYSSGMYVRLAFAVAAHLETEILLVDEVLAVGDADFQRKCIEKIAKLVRAGRSIILVSHTRSLIREACHKAVVLAHGRAEFEGSAARAIDYHQAGDEALPTSVQLEGLARLDPQLPKTIELTSLAMRDPGGRVAYGDRIAVTVGLKAHEVHDPFRLSLTVYHDSGAPIATSFVRGIQPLTIGDRRELTVAMQLPLVPGRYSVGAAVGLGDEAGDFLDFDFVFSCLHFDVDLFSLEGRAFGSWLDHFGPLRPPDLRICDESDESPISFASLASAGRRQ